MRIYTKSPTRFLTRSTASTCRCGAPPPLSPTRNRIHAPSQWSTASTLPNAEHRLHVRSLGTSSTASTCRCFAVGHLLHSLNVEPHPPGLVEHRLHSLQRGAPPPRACSWNITVSPFSGVGAPAGLGSVISPRLVGSLASSVNAGLRNPASLSSAAPNFPGRSNSP